MTMQGMLNNKFITFCIIGRVHLNFSMTYQGYQIRPLKSKKAMQVSYAFLCDLGLHRHYVSHRKFVIAF